MRRSSSYSRGRSSLRCTSCTSSARATSATRATSRAGKQEQRGRPGTRTGAMSSCQTSRPIVASLCRLVGWALPTFAIAPLMRLLKRHSTLPLGPPAVADHLQNSQSALQCPECLTPAAAELILPANSQDSLSPTGKSPVPHATHARGLPPAIMSFLATGRLW